MSKHNIEEIIEANQFKIFKYCYYMLRCTESAEDITQEVFLKYYQLLQNNKKYTTSYLYAIAHSKCIDYLRKQKKKTYLI